MNDDTTTHERTRTHWPLPHRSATDRKLGGVAGGLGRAWHVDPILIRVAFVVLALFGGSGVLLYCAGWLLMRGDGEDASAIEALAGRGKSSVSPALTVVLIVVGLASMGSIFSWGIPFWPVVVGAIILTVVLSRRHVGCGHRDAAHWVDDFADRAARWGQNVGDRAARWGQSVGDRADGWFGGSSTTTAPDATTSATTAAAPGTDERTAPAGAGETTAGAASTQSTPVENAPAPDPDDLPSDSRTPPAWDPLGAAPFAWDLPEPTPMLADAAAETADSGTAGKTHAYGSAIGRMFLGLALIVGSLAGTGVAAGWWDLSWSAVTGLTLAVVAVGLALAALRGRGGRMLIGPGVFLAVLTLALTVSGLTGTSGYGQHTWTPATVDAVAGSYYWNAGQATLDLSQLSVPPGQTVHTDVTIGGGQVTVLLPAGTGVVARCSATVGQVECLGQQSSGVRAEHLVERPSGSSHGTIDIDVHSNAGQAVLKTYE